MAAAFAINLSVVFLISSLLNISVISAPLAEMMCNKTVSPDYCTYCFNHEGPGGRVDDTLTPADLGNLAIGCTIKVAGVFQKHLKRYTSNHELSLKRRAEMCITLLDTVVEDLKAAGWSLGLGHVQEAVSSAQTAKLDLQRCTDLFDVRHEIPTSCSGVLLRIQAYAANAPEILVQLKR